MQPPAAEIRTSRRSFLALSASAAAAALAGCHSHNAPLQPVAPALSINGGGSLRIHAAEHHLLFGTAVHVPSLQQDTAYARLIREQCSIVVPENCMKWKDVEPAQGQFRFEEADYLADFAAKYQIKLRGHTMVWHKHVPAWVTRQNARTLIRQHVQLMGTRYAGRMHSWDVVNEAIEPKDGRPDGLRNSLWLQMAGNDYIEEAYRTARLADPTALLTYNDYGLELDIEEHEQRRMAVLLLLRRLKQRNVPIDAIGIQSHLGANPMHSYGHGLRRFMEAVRDLGLQTFVTELDVNDNKMPNDTKARAETDAQTAGKYLDVVLGDPSVRAVLTWGISTKHTWLRDEYKNSAPQGMLFDDNYQPLPMFSAVRDAFDRRQSMAAPANLQNAYPPVHPWG